ncbi:MAG: HNH endonuclease, partial [Shewanella sp.]
HGVIQLSGNKLQGESKLAVCKNCLKALNYQDYLGLNDYARNHLVAAFSFIDFFDCYRSYFSSLPTSNLGSLAGNYTADWKSISKSLRHSVDFCCEHCEVNLTKHPELLHVHHINGNKSDNDRKNLRALCMDCHKKQPNHEHLQIVMRDIEKINYLRRQQNKFDVFDYVSLHKYADTSLLSLTKLLERYQLTVPQLGLTVKIGQKHIPLDLCWPKNFVAVLIESSHRTELKKNGWTVFSTFEAINKIHKLQALLR